jgi:hypothetical protein
MAGDPTSLAELIARLYGNPVVAAETAHWDLQPYAGRRGSYFCRSCQQRVQKADLAGIFHHRQRGHEPLAKEGGEGAPSLSEQLTRAFDQALGAD